MDGTPAQIVRLWNHYLAMTQRYAAARRAVDAAEAACRVAYDQCEAAHAEEVKWARAVVLASHAFQAATDAAFLMQNGIQVTEPFVARNESEDR